MTHENCLSFLIMYASVNCATRLIFLAVYIPVEVNAVHLGSIGCMYKARVAVLFCYPKIISVPQVDGCSYHQLCCLFL